MKTPKIKKITVFFNDGTYEVYNHGQNGITEILDKTPEYENSVNHFFYIMKGDSVFVELINVPSIVEHFN